jgi:bifunctional non-homologous end joining protein LigD
MPLETYNAKRNFSKTAEPKGKVAKRSGSALSYVIQKHDASRLHYDFRLELDAVLLSWAVPKGPSLDPSKKALAVRVEDHPLDYGSFEGTIPQGQYGGGTVAIWDRGTWEPIGDPHQSLKSGKLSFTLNGERLHGEWALVKLHGRDGEEKNWLLMKKKKDEFATGDEFEGADSIVTGRTLEEIAGGKKATGLKRGAKTVWQSHRASKTSSEKPKAAPAEKKATSAKMSADLPVFSPQLAVLADVPPAGKEWSHEIKYDGYRLLAKVRDGKVELVTRNGNDWTHRFKTLADSLADLPLKNAILDGEAVVLDAEGKSDFQALQMMLKNKEKVRPVFFAFDLLHLDGVDLRDQPFKARAKALQSLLKKAKLRDNIRMSEQIDVPGDAVLKQACKLGLEGIISKRLDAPYVSRRDPTWLKIKCGQRQEFVIVGFSQPQRSRVGIGALLLGYHDDKKRLVYAGRVGTGFDTRMLKDLRAMFDKITVKQSPLDVDAPAREQKAATWVKPTQVAEITFTGWTRDGMLRHPVFVALRSDKPAGAIVREKTVSTARVVKEVTAKDEAKLNRGKASASGSNTPIDVAGVTLSHPDKVLFPDVNLTKLDIAQYVHLASKWMLPHVADRPLALVRCPAGRAQKCFFQRNWTDTLPDDLAPVNVGEKGKKDEHISLDSVRGLIALVQMGVLEIHTWGCTANDIESPDQLVFDLDPAEDVAWKDVVAGARTVRKTLEQLDLPVFLKTSGGKGLHLVVPLKPTITWDEAKAFTGEVARQLEETTDRFVANMRKDLRHGKIFLDFHRNQRSATSVAPYSTRARPGAPVSMPISWEELGKLTSASQFTVETARRYLTNRRTDPWQAFGRSRVDLHKRLKRSSAA